MPATHLYRPLIAAGITITKYTLPKTAICCLWRSMLRAIPARLCLIAFTFCQPFLITATLSTLQDGISESTKSKSYGLIGAAGLIYVGIAVSPFAQNDGTRVDLVLDLYCTLSTTILSLPDHVPRCHGMPGLQSLPAASRPSQARESCHYSHVDRSDRTCSLLKCRRLTSIGADIDTIVECLVEINEIWANAIEVVLGISLLANKIGAICVIPIILICVCSYAQSFVAKRIGAKRMGWNRLIQSRVSLTSSVLSGIKAIRTMGKLERISLDGL